MRPSRTGRLTNRYMDMWPKYRLATVTDSCVFLSCRRLLDTEDELSDLQGESVPKEVRDWLACTFTRKMGVAKRRPEEKPRFRSIVHAVQAGIFVER